MVTIWLQPYGGNLVFIGMKGYLIELYKNNMGPRLPWSAHLNNGSTLH